MKYLLLHALICIFLIIISSIVAVRIAKKKNLRKKSRVFLALGFSLLIIIVYNLGILQLYYHADEKALSSLDGSDNVDVLRIGKDYFFDGPGQDEAIVFIPGACVEEAAYAPLLTKIAGQGVDCFLMKVPFRMATFDLNAVERVTGSYDYKRWYVMGHSLGGIVSSAYAGSHEDTIDGVVLLASYPTTELPDSLSLLCICGSNDGCLSMSRYEKSKKLWPDDGTEVIIDGGNHSNFGNYGLQIGDKEAALSADEQQDFAAGEIVKFIRKY